MNEKETISYIINTSKNIAIFALSPDKTKASYRVADFLQRKNYKIFPIYPKEEFILNEKVYRNLDQIEEKIDTLILFRKGKVALEIFFLSLLKKILKTYGFNLALVMKQPKKNVKN